MKTFIKSAFLLCFAFIAMNMVIHAQTAKSFKGILTETLSYSGEVDAATLAQLPKTSTTYIMNNKKKSHVDYGQAVIDVITDGDKKEIIVLFEQMGMKGYIKMDKNELDAAKDDKGKTEIKYLDETKTIAGYSCKKALCINAQEETSDTTTVFYTEELGGEALNFGDNQYEGLKGFPMEVQTKQGSIRITATITEVKKGKVKDTDFLIPADFTEVTGEMRNALKSMFTGGEE
jgi:GLPGLI family protein